MIHFAVRRVGRRQDLRFPRLLRRPGPGRWPRLRPAF